MGPVYNLDAHVARAHGIGEHHVFDFVVHRVADEQSAVVHVLVVVVVLVGDEHLEHANHLVRVATGLHGHAGDGLHASAVHGHPLAGGVAPRDPRALGVERALRPTGARRRVGERRGVIAICLLGVQRERLADLGRVQQAHAHGDAPVPRRGLDAHETRLHGRIELGLLDVLGAVVLDAGELVGAVDVRPRPVNSGADGDFILGDALVRSAARLHHDTDDRAVGPGIHDVPLLVVVRTRRPALVGVQHAAVVARAGRVVAQHARLGTRRVGRVEQDLAERRAAPLLGHERRQVLLGGVALRHHRSLYNGRDAALHEGDRGRRALDGGGRGRRRRPVDLVGGEVDRLALGEILSNLLELLLHLVGVVGHLLRLRLGHVEFGVALGNHAHGRGGDVLQAAEPHAALGDVGAKAAHQRVELVRALQQVRLVLHRLLLVHLDLRLARLDVIREVRGSLRRHASSLLGVVLERLDPHNLSLARLALRLVESLRLGVRSRLGVRRLLEARVVRLERVQLGVQAGMLRRARLLELVCGRELAHERLLAHDARRNLRAGGGDVLDGIRHDFVVGLDLRLEPLRRLVAVLDLPGELVGGVRQVGVHAVHLVLHALHVRLHVLHDGVVRAGGDVARVASLVARVHLPGQRLANRLELRLDVAELVAARLGLLLEVGDPGLGRAGVDEHLRLLLGERFDLFIERRGGVGELRLDGVRLGLGATHLLLEVCNHRRKRAALRDEELLRLGEVLDLRGHELSGLLQV